MASDEMRLDELAQRAGVASTTVRLYQAKGLLPGPRIVGRTGYYDTAHLARLQLIARLQTEGFSLAGIRRLLDSWSEGRDLAAVVGVEEQLAALLHNADSVELTPDELAAHFPAATLTPALLARAVHLGLVEPLEDGRLRVPDRRFLATGSALVRLGLPADVLLDEWEELLARTDEIADRFIALFADHLATGDDAHIAATLAQLRTQATDVLQAAFATSLSQKATTYLTNPNAPRP